MTTKPDAPDTDPTPPEPDDAPPAPPADDEAAKWKALARKHEAQAKANAEAARKLAELEEADKTEAQRLADAKDAAERRAAEAEANLARLKVAASKGLPADLADRLVGSTEEELAEDADRLLALVKPTTPPPPGSADAGPVGPPDPSKPKQLTRADLAAMTPDEIVKAKADGQLADLLGEN